MVYPAIFNMIIQQLGVIQTILDTKIYLYSLDQLDNSIAIYGTFCMSKKEKQKVQ